MSLKHYSFEDAYMNELEPPSHNGLECYASDTSEV